MVTRIHDPELSNSINDIVSRPRGRPRKPYMRDKILAAARAHFAEYGLDGTSMDRIAESAGTSKVTMYNHFPSKEALFNAIATEDRTHAFDLNMDSLNIEDPFSGLMKIATHYNELVTNIEVVNHMRVIAGNVNRYPSIGASFYRTGPAKVAEKVAQYLSKLADAKILNLTDPRQCAEQFLGLLKGQEYMRTVLGVPLLSRPEQQEYLESCVKMFLRAYMSFHSKE